MSFNNDSTFNGGNDPHDFHQRMMNMHQAMHQNMMAMHDHMHSMMAPMHSPFGMNSPFGMGLPTMGMGMDVGFGSPMLPFGGHSPFSHPMLAHQAAMQHHNALVSSSQSNSQATAPFQPNVSFPASTSRSYSYSSSTVISGDGTRRTVVSEKQQCDDGTGKPIVEERHGRAIQKGDILEAQAVHCKPDGKATLFHRRAMGDQVRERVREVPVEALPDLGLGVGVGKGVGAGASAGEGLVEERLIGLKEDEVEQFDQRFNERAHAQIQYKQ